MSWEKTSVGEIITTKKGFAFKSSKYVNKGVPIVRVSDYTLDSISDTDLKYYPYEEKQNFIDFELHEKDVIVQTVGSWQNNPASVVGKVVRVPYFLDGALLNQNAVKLTPIDGVDNNFLFYRLKTDEFKGHVLGEARGAANQASITLDTIKSFKFLIPDYSMQKRIGEILGSYDALIENNQKQIKLLEEAVQRLYKEWFVDFRFPGYEDTDIVDGIPVGWDKTTMDKICDSVGGGTPSTKVEDYYRDGNIKWVTPTDITRNDGLILLDTEKKITQEGLKNSSAKMVPPNTILMTSRASVGYFGICEYEVCTNQGFISCIPNQENYRWYLLYNLLNRVDEIRQKASGSTFLEISKRAFRELIILKPNDKVLDAFDKEIISLLQQMKVLKKQIVLLQNCRDSLLPKLISGKIEV